MKNILLILLLGAWSISNAQMKEDEKVDAQGIDIKFEVNDTKGKNKEVSAKEACLILTNNNDKLAKVSFTVVFMENDEVLEESGEMSFEIKPGKSVKGKAKGLCWEFNEENMKKYDAGTLVLDLNEYEVKM